MTEQTAASQGVIQNQGLLDLTGWTAEDMARIKRVINVGVILVPQSMTAALAAVPQENVGSIIPVPEGEGIRTRVHTGAISMSGDALAGGENELLVVTGMLVVTSPVERVGYRDIVVTGLVLAPHGSEAALGPAITRLTGTVVYYTYADGQQVRAMPGDMTLSGEALANPGGDSNDILVVAGQLVLTSPVTKLGYQHLVVAGELVAPRESELVLSPMMTVPGEMIWYTGRPPRFFTGNDRFARGFFELFDEPVTLVLKGDHEIAADVPAELLKEKVAEIVLTGKLVAPERLVPVLQFLTTRNQGSITAGGPADADQ